MGVPNEWTRLIEHHRIARQADYQMKRGEVGSASSDIAMQKYMASVDVIMECLDALAEQDVFGPITMFLAIDTLL
jgi:hypothetical protein